MWQKSNQRRTMLARRSIRNEVLTTIEVVEWMTCMSNVQNRCKCLHCDFHEYSTRENVCLIYSLGVVLGNIWRSVWNPNHQCTDADDDQGCGLDGMHKGDAGVAARCHDRQARVTLEQGFPSAQSSSPISRSPISCPRSPIFISISIKDLGVAGVSGQTSQGQFAAWEINTSSECKSKAVFP